VKSSSAMNKGVCNEFSLNYTAGQELRREVLGQIATLLKLTESIDDSQVRLAMQACCLDAVTGLEEVVRKFRLDGLYNEQ